MTTDPTLVYAVIRDPPGGSSSATLGKGSTLSTTMAIDGMHTATRSQTSALNYNNGIESQISTMAAPLGMGVGVNLLGLTTDSVKSYSGNAPSVEAERTSGEEFDLNFQFDIDITTSTNPWTAGQASDIIVGGGVSLRVSKALEVEVSVNDDDEYDIRTKDSNTWNPEKISTFVMSVREIETTMERLGLQYKSEVGSPDGNLEKADEIEAGIQNWKKVLETYRKQPMEEPVSVFEAVQRLVDHFEVVFSDATTEAATTFEAFNDEMGTAERPAAEAYGTFLAKGLDLMKENQREVALTTAAGADKNLGGLGIGLAALKSRFTNPTSIPGVVADFTGGAFIAGAGLGMSDLGTDARRIQNFATDVGTAVTKAIDDNCQNAGPNVAGKLCDAATALKSKVDLASRLLGICDLQSGVLKSVDAFCRKDDAKRLPRSVLDFLSDDTKLLTFGGGSTVTMTSTIEQAKAISQSSTFQTSQSDDYESSSNYCFSAGRRERNRRLLAKHLANHEMAAKTNSSIPRRVLDRGIHDRRLLGIDDDDDDDDDVYRRLMEAPPPLKRQGASKDLLAETKKEKAPQCRRLFDIGVGFANTESGSIGVSLGRSAQRDKGASHTITFELNDPDPEDFFAVRIASDPVYATPIFETLGGLSTCPGETSTTKRDSQVKIFDINYDRCSSINCQNEPHGSKVQLGIIIQNISPAGTITDPGRNTPLYQLFVGSPLGPWDAGNTDYCGADGNAAGMTGLIYEYQGLRIEPPYGQSEILLELGHSATCFNYNKIQVKIVAACELGTPTSQYSTTLDTDSGDITVVYPEWDDDEKDWTGNLPNFPRRYATSDSVSETTFSISWAEPSRRTLSVVDDETSFFADDTKSFIIIALTALNTLVVTLLAIAFLAYSTSQQKQSRNLCLAADV